MTNEEWIFLLLERHEETFTQINQILTTKLQPPMLPIGESASKF